MSGHYREAELGGSERPSCPCSHVGGMVLPGDAMGWWRGWRWDDAPALCTHAPGRAECFTLATWFGQAEHRMAAAWHMGVNPISLGNWAKRRAETRGKGQALQHPFFGFCFFAPPEDEEAVMRTEQGGRGHLPPPGELPADVLLPSGGMRSPVHSFLHVFPRCHLPGDGS